MRMGQIFLTHDNINGGVPVRIICDGIKIGGSKNTDATPEQNIGDNPTQVQTLSPENLIFTLSNVTIYPGKVNTFQWEHLITLLFHKYTGGNPVILNVTYNPPNTSTMDLTGMEGASNIRVVLEDFSFNLRGLGVGKDDRLHGTIKFVETK